MDSFVKKVKLFREIHWSTATLTICSLPLALSFILMHLISIILEGRTGAIVSDSKICTKIGKNVLVDGGSVVDAAIAIIFCESVLLPSRVGIGGGFSAIVYMNRAIDTITATPKVPYGIQSGYMQTSYSYTGAEGSAVPGALMGCWKMHRKYGVLAWTRLLQPTIELCEQGVPTEHFRQYNLNKQKTIVDGGRNRAMKRILETRSNETDGEKIKFLVLAQTLRLIAKKGVDVFYNDTVGEDLIRDVQDGGGFLTMADLKDYNVSWNGGSVSFRIRANIKAYTTPLPTSGAIVALVINVIKNMPDKGSPLFWHRTIEAMKHAYGLSFDLADIENEPNKNVVQFVQAVYKKMINMDFAVYVRDLISDEQLNHNLSYYGVKRRSSLKSTSANICITSSNGDAIALTSGLLVEHEKAFYSKSTGILLNNEINTFKPNNKHKLPLSFNSYLRPGKRAFSAHSPVIVLNKLNSEVSLLVSATGGEMAAAQVITTLINSCFERQNAHNSSNSFFFYPDVFNEKVWLQTSTTGSSLNPAILKFLRKLGHNIAPMLSAFPFAFRSLIVQNSLITEAEYTSYQQESGTDFVDPKSELNFFLLFIVVGISAILIAMMCVEIAHETKAGTLIEYVSESDLTSEVSE